MRREMIVVPVYEVGPISGNNLQACAELLPLIQSEQIEFSFLAFPDLGEVGEGFVQFVRIRQD